MKFNIIDRPFPLRWHKWYAWYPIKTTDTFPNRYIWLEEVERKILYGNKWMYREIKKE